MADDKYGYKTLFFSINGKDIELISYHYIENDTYSYIRRGGERRISIEFSNYVTCDLLKFVIDKLNPSKGIKNILQKMIDADKIESGEYWDIDE